MENTHFVLLQLYKISHIPIHFYSQTNELLLFHEGFSDEHNPFINDETLKTELLALPQLQGYPVMKLEDDVFLYAVFIDVLGNKVIAGPICANNESEEKIANYKKKHGIAAQNFTLKVRSVSGFSAFVTMLFYCLTNRCISEANIWSHTAQPSTEDETQYEYQQHVLENSENNVKYLNFYDENLYFRPLVEGNVEQVKKHFVMANDDHVPRLAKGNLKHYEYMLCTSITLAARYAIKGGLKQETAFSMSELYHHFLENCRTINDYFRLQQDMMIAFTTRVKQSKQISNQNPVVEKCKSYIDSHLNANFSLDDIAKELFTNKSYLSRLFSKTEGIGISVYTKKKRIEAAKNMLRFSDTPLADISMYLCFPTQSYFTKIFRQETGITPLQYRNQKSFEELPPISI